MCEREKNCVCEREELCVKERRTVCEREKEGENKYWFYYYVVSGGLPHEAQLINLMDTGQIERQR